jgi:hypothetical protein
MDGPAPHPDTLSPAQRAITTATRDDLTRIAGLLDRLACYRDIPASATSTGAPSRATQPAVGTDQ